MVEVRSSGQPTTVVLQQPMAVMPTQGYSLTREWSSGICSCFDDCESCLCAGFCFPCYLCHVYNISNEACWLPLMGIGVFPLRIKHRIKHNINGSILDDNFVTGCCPQLALCQLRRDMKFMGS
ncbi:unnamed protein product [Schistosoma rodhaini]|uniref:Uncharacterized protein n=1 Tax=Schistosoma rodhaini TaxID=6188 RepID=A0AA85EMI5_9TREM|nr:unnamed protein product [Schistosoma rodhaini]CAH8680564.1 unnamed protein product [Schistosoma rodhaini]